MALRKKDILCLVKLPNETTLAYFIHPESTGRDLLKMVCDQLNLLEMDYFGLIHRESFTLNSAIAKNILTTTDSTDPHPMWINLRNPINKEIGFQHPVIFELSVKFFVECHHLQQDITRQLFFLVAVQNIHKQFSPHFNSDILTSLMQLTTSHPSLFKSIQMPSFINKEALAARNQFLRLIFPHMEGWGHTHRVNIGGLNLVMIVTQEGITLYNSTANQMLYMHTWCSIQMASQTSRTILIQILNDNSTSTVTEVLLNSKRDADALYRDLTEVYSFYCCETVFNSVTEQVSRDLKGLIISLFNETANTGHRYVFDLEKTLKEVYESVRRKLYVLVDKNKLLTKAITTDDALLSCQGSNNEMTVKLQSIIDSFKCMLCFSEEITLVFIPCGHMVTCQSCSKKVTICPLCNANIVSVQRIYLPIQLS